MRPKTKDYVSRLKRQSSDKLKKHYIGGLAPEINAIRRNILFMATALLFMLFVFISENMSFNDTVEIVLLIKQPIKAYGLVVGTILIVVYMLLRLWSYQNVHLVNRDEFLEREIISAIVGDELSFLLKDNEPKPDWHEGVIRSFVSSDVTRKEALANGVYNVHYRIPEADFKKLRINREQFESDLTSIGISAQSNGETFHFSHEIRLDAETLLAYLTVRDNIIKVNWHLFWEFRFPSIYAVFVVISAVIWLLVPFLKGLSVT
ncbi:hypothetical protein [Vibrio sp. ED002]|uniref:hypothetical protein n=1 Tax=Vibrio sp. ED002 TaxID=2785123 RepID=UPI00200CADBA|nr:hypothetical protein [Vibrio sp. ED002]UQA50941.1 hypothetical protein ITG12_00925 [Vibrio sp. ED002]